MTRCHSSAMGGGFWLFGASHSPHYSITIILWAATLVEYWNVVEREISGENIRCFAGREASTRLHQ